MNGKLITSKCDLPIGSVFNDGPTPDYIDCYKVSFSDEKNLVTPIVLGKNFFTSGPKWMKVLFEFRERVAKLVGLKTGDKISDRQKALDEFNCEVGQQLSLFKVFEKTNSEVIMGEDDKHLNFRISIYLEEGKGSEKILTLTTTVQFNNWFGKLYFFPVKPFHKLIVPSIMKGMVRNSLS